MDTISSVQERMLIHEYYTKGIRKGLWKHLRAKYGDKDAKGNWIVPSPQSVKQWIKAQGHRPSKKAEEMLHKVYYDENNYHGRDRLLHVLYSKYGKDHKDMPKQREIMWWLARQEAHQKMQKPRARTSIKPVEQKKAGTLQIDHTKISPKNGRFEWILVMVDTFTKHVWAKAVMNTGAAIALRIVEQWVEEGRRKGQKFDIIFSDQGFGGESGVFSRGMERLGIKHVTNKANTPQSSGVVERTHGTLKQALKTYMIAKNTKMWTSVLQQIVDNHNDAKSFSTGKAPASMANEDEEVKQKIEARQNRALKPDANSFLKKGDHVRVKIPKEKALKKGPPYWSDTVYVIHEVIEPKKENLLPRYKVAKQTGGLLKGTYSGSTLLHVPTD